MEINSVFIIVGIFLLLCLFSGLWAGRGTKTFEQYAVGDKNFSTATLVTTLIATSFGGGLLFRNLEQLYTNGLYFGIALIFASCSFFFISRFMAPRMGEFLKHVSIAESMGSLFGRNVRMLTAISGIFCSVGIIALQIQLISRILKLCCNIEGNLPSCLAVLIVLLYSTYGGIKAVTFTDMIQFFSFTALIPLLIYLVSRNIDHSTSYLTIFTTHSNFDIKQVLGSHTQFRNTLWLILLYISPNLEPASLQRVYMAKNVKQVQSSFAYTALIATIIRIIIICLAITLLLYNDALDPKKLIDHIVKMYNYVWLKSCICIGVLALTMSTADSELHASSILCIDLIKSSLKTVNIKNELRIVHLCSLLIGISAFWFSFYETDLLRLIILAMDFYEPIVVVPFILAVFGFRPTSKSVLIGMLAGALTILAFNNGLGDYLHIQYETFPAMLMNLLFLVGSYYILPKVPGTGWVGIKDITPLLAEKQKREHRRAERKEFWKQFSLSTYLQSLVPQRDFSFFALGLYVFITQSMRFYIGFWKVSIFIWLPTTLISILFFFYPMFITRYQLPTVERIFSYIYPFLLGLIFFVSGSYMLYIHHYGPISMHIFFTNILISMLLLPKMMVVAMVVVAWAGMYSIPGRSDIVAMIAQEWRGEWDKFICTLLTFVVIYVVIEYLKKELQQHKKKLSSVCQDKANSQANKLKKIQYHYQTSRLTYQNGCKEKILPAIRSDIEGVIQDKRLPADLKETLYASTDRLNGYGQFIEESRYTREFHLCLDPQPVDIASFFRHLVSKLATLDCPVSIILHKQTQVTTLCADPIRLEQLFVNWVYYISLEHKDVDSQTKILHLYILDTAIEYSLNKEGFSKTLPALAFVLTTVLAQPAIETIYKDSLDDLSYIAPKDIHELYKHVIFRTVTAHYGCCHFMEGDDSTPIKGAVPPHEDYCIPIKGAVPLPLTLALPIDLMEIRDEIMNKVPEQPCYPIAETAASLAQEKALERLLVQATPLTSLIIQETIQFIKLCHGDQVRASGEPYYIHPMAVAELLLEETTDPSAIIAALLHDVIEDSKVSIAYIQSKYGNRVADIVATVTHMGDSFRKKKLSKSESEEHLRQFKDLAAVQVKIADRLHNVLTLKYRPKEKQIKVAQQTLDFYLPFAESVGVVKVTKRLRRLCEEILS